jgi:hypothetical protein
MTTVEYYDCNNTLQVIYLDPQEIVPCFNVNSNGFSIDNPFSVNNPITQYRC